MAEFWAAIKFLGELLEIGRAIFADYKEGRREGWIGDGRQIAREYKGAKTDEERWAALRKLVGHRGSIPR